ncbi:Uma2 family endonuclease [Kitasatospora sp. NPDC096077]|uniref:Uma2 family endonuclease n=1 Tax=Kitasatospora sp. NPDC096077 TaxID=3155544 RepID=UPI0033205D7D
MDELPDWMYPPRAEGWFADDLDHLPQAPPHTELLHGALVFRLAPQHPWHNGLATRLTSALAELAPDGVLARTRRSVTLDEWNRLEPDVLVSAVTDDPSCTGYRPREVVLVVEVVSPESECRDRGVKFHKYAEAGIPHYWIVDEEDGAPVAHVYELEQATSSYAPAGIFRGVLERPVPFPISIDLARAAD